MHQLHLSTLEGLGDSALVPLFISTFPWFIVQSWSPAWVPSGRVAGFLLCLVTLSVTSVVVYFSPVLDYGCFQVDRANSTFPDSSPGHCIRLELEMA